MFSHVNWPHQYDPRGSAIYALNDVDVKAPPEVVWQLLVDAEKWSSYFPAENQTKILTGEPELALGTKYSRVTVGFPMSLVVMEHEACRRISWATTVDGDETGSSAYHGWVITPTDDGCHVLSEETQQGPWFLEEIGRKHPGALYAYHQEWVECLARAAEAEAAKVKIWPPRFSAGNRGEDTVATSDIEEVLALFRGVASPSRVVRVFQDGPYVFTHGEGLILGQGVFFDLFRFEHGLIVEHWAFSAKGAPPNQSGHTQTDGSTTAKSLEETEKNKSIVRDYYQTVHVAGDHSKIPNYFSGDHCIRHEPGVRDGVAAFKRDLAELVKHRRIDEIKFVLGHGDFVFIAAKGSRELAPCVYIDLYRVENEKIAERWGFPEEVPAQAEWKNNNGML